MVYMTEYSENIKTLILASLKLNDAFRNLKKDTNKSRYQMNKLKRAIRLMKVNSRKK